MSKRLHGQSIKTRVEAPFRPAPPLPSKVYTDNPLKQGLKLVDNLEIKELVGLSTRTIH